MEVGKRRPDNDNNRKRDCSRKKTEIQGGRHLRVTKGRKEEFGSYPEEERSDRQRKVKGYGENENCCPRVREQAPEILFFSGLAPASKRFLSGEFCGP